MIVQREIICKIGEVKIAKSGELLRAMLGSCVGIGMIWRNEKRCALAHCLLSEQPVKTFEITARYVSQAIPSLLTLLKTPQDRYGELEIVLAGGAHMMGPTVKSEVLNIGRANVECAQKRLQELKLHVIHQEVGGILGRHIAIDSETFAYSIRTIKAHAA
ncbi:MAG: hypothetical protein EOP09_18945 [Proteobacteria bacterium]|nr:MAG: hypothetical protein EOP09_18945 [Pseudomonadota bacterium]